MKRVFVLSKNKNYGEITDKTPLILVENKELYFEFVGEMSGLLLVTLKNGLNKKQVIISDNKLAVPQEFIAEGLLEITVSSYTSSGLKDRWVCEPITILQPQEEVFEGYPKITTLESEIAELKAQMQVMDEIIKDLQNQIGRLWEVAES